MQIEWLLNVADHVYMSRQQKSFQVIMTNFLWRFMWNTHQSWNQDLVAFLCTGGVEVVITRWQFAANAVLRKLYCLKFIGSPE